MRVKQEDHVIAELVYIDRNSDSWYGDEQRNYRKTLVLCGQGLKM